MSIIKFRKLPELFPNRKVRIVRIRNNYAIQPFDNRRYDPRPTCCGLLHCGLDKLCGRPPQCAPPPASWPFDLESGFRVTCDVAYLCANFSLPRPLCSRFRLDVRDRQTSWDVRRASSLKAPYSRGGGITNRSAWFDSLVFSGTFSTDRLYRAIGVWSMCCVRPGGHTSTSTNRTKKFTQTRSSTLAWYRLEIISSSRKGVVRGVFLADCG